jgi:hypothetical protein
METPERLENCPPTPEEVLEGSSGYLEEARVSKLKLQEASTCVICYSSCKDKSFPECCLHIFCFECLCKWSKQKNQCPLCKKGEFDGKVDENREKVRERSRRKSKMEREKSTKNFSKLAIFL